MKARHELTLFDSPKNTARVRKYFYIVLVILLVVDFFIPKHGHFPWERAYAFYAVYGFIGCVSLIFIAKGLRWLVKRKEGYYD
jgi:membrane protease YdiL (CAAX protease family)